MFCSLQNAFDGFAVRGNFQRSHLKLLELSKNFNQARKTFSCNSWRSGVEICEFSLIRSRFPRKISDAKSIEAKSDHKQHRAKVLEREEKPFFQSRRRKKRFKNEKMCRSIGNKKRKINQNINWRRKKTSPTLFSLIFVYNIVSYVRNNFAHAFSYISSKKQPRRVKKLWKIETINNLKSFVKLFSLSIFFHIQCRDRMKIILSFVNFSLV